MLKQEHIAHQSVTESLNALIERLKKGTEQNLADTLIELIQQIEGQQDKIRWILFVLEQYFKSLFTDKKVVNLAAILSLFKKLSLAHQIEIDVLLSSLTMPAIANQSHCYLTYFLNQPAADNTSILIDFILTLRLLDSSQEQKLNHFLAAITLDGEIAKNIIQYLAFRLSCDRDEEWDEVLWILSSILRSRFKTDIDVEVKNKIFCQLILATAFSSIYNIRRRIQACFTTAALLLKKTNSEMIHPDKARLFLEQLHQCLLDKDFNDKHTLLACLPPLLRQVASYIDEQTLINQRRFKTLLNNILNAFVHLNQDNQRQLGFIFERTLIGKQSLLAFIEPSMTEAQRCDLLKNNVVSKKALLSHLSKKDIKARRQDILIYIDGLNAKSQRQIYLTMIYHKDNPLRQLLLPKGRRKQKTTLLAWMARSDELLSIKSSHALMTTLGPAHHETADKIELSKQCLLSQDKPVSVEVDESQAWLLSHRISPSA